MSRADITETCGCGATLHVVMDSDLIAQETSTAWRLNHRHEPAPTPDPEPEPERHDSTLDAMVERSGGERDPKAELDYRTRMGFRP